MCLWRMNVRIEFFLELHLYITFIIEFDYYIFYIPSAIDFYIHARFSFSKLLKLRGLLV